MSKAKVLFSSQNYRNIFIFSASHFNLEEIDPLIHITHKNKALLLIACYSCIKAQLGVDMLKGDLERKDDNFIDIFNCK